MSKLKLTLKPLALCLFTFIFASLVQAGTLPNRTYVSAMSGSDANDCTRSSPCRYFQRAVNTVAAGGEVVALDNGGYGAVGISKAVTIEAPNGVYAGIEASKGDAIFIKAAPSDTVVIRGLTLNGLGKAANGINYTAGGVLHVESCVISGFGTGLNFAAPGQLLVLDTIARNNGTGINVTTFSGFRPTINFADPKQLALLRKMAQEYKAAGNNNAPSSGPALASIDHCRLEANFTGLYVADNGIVTIRDSVAAGNSAFGLIVLAFSPAELTVENCLVTGSEFGISDALSALIRLSNAVVTDNMYGVFSPSGFGAAFISFGNNKVNGNSGSDVSVNSFTVVPQI